MRTCHACQAELDVPALMAGRCPNCNTPIPRNAPNTIQDTWLLGDLQSAETNPEFDKEDSEEESIELEPAPQDESSLDSHSVADDGTIELAPRLSDDETAPTGSHDDETEDDGATVDLQPPTVGDHGDMTIDFGEGENEKQDADTPPAGSATEPLISDATVDLGEAGNEIQATDDSELKKLPSTWKGTYDDRTKVGQTIRQQASAAGFRASLPIKSRFISQRREEGKSRVTFQPGEVPDYELLDVIGEGGMGVVYSAHQSSIARTVAIKMLKPTKKVGEEQRDKFISEAVVTGELDHPNIVPIYDLGANDSGALFYSMKRVKGTPWDKAIDSKSLDENLQILLRVADAVAFAHAHGVVHRDLKPENVMLGDYGEVLVMDWGLARVTPEFANAGSIYQADSLGGTPAYMAPEMARGPASRIDFRSDIYLLGAILYEIIGGRPPHSGRDVMQCLMAAAQNRIDSIEYEGELKSIAMRAMAPASEDRYETVKHFQDAIRTYQSHSESLLLTTHASGSLEKARNTDEYDQYERAVYGFQEAINMWAGNHKAAELLTEAQYDYARVAYERGDYDLAISRLDRDRVEHAELLTKVEQARNERNARESRLRSFRRIVAALVLAITGILAVATVWISHARQEAEAARNLETEARQEAEQQRNEAVLAKEQEEIARKQEETAKLQEQQAKQEALQQKENAERQEQIAVDRRREAELAKEQEQHARQNEARQRQLAEVAKEAEEYEAYIARIGLAAAKIDENAFDYALELLRDCQQDLRHWEWGRLVYLCQLSTSTIDLGAPVDSVAYAPGGDQYAVGDWSGQTTIHETASGQQAGSFDFGQYVHSVAYSPDGTLLAAGGSDDSIHIVNLETGEVSELAGHQDDVLCVRFSPDGRELLSTSFDNTARRWDLETGRELQVLRGHTWWVWSADFAPDQSRIVTAGQDGRAVVWELNDSPASAAQRGTYGKLTEFSGHEGAVFAARFSPNGRLVATGGYDNTVRIWNPDLVEPVDLARRLQGESKPPPQQQVLSGHDGPVRSVDFSRTDPQLLVSGSHDNTLRMWDVDSGNLIKTFRGHSGRVRASVFSPRGNQLLSGGHDRHVRLWNIEGYQEVRVLRGRVLRGHQDAVLSARFSHDGQRVITASRDRTAGLWDVGSGQQVQLFSEGHQFLASNVVFFPDGRRMATGAGDNSVRIWDVASGTELRSLSPTGRMGTLAVSPDGTLIVTGSPGQDALIWEAQSGKQLASLQGHPAEVTVATFSADGRMLITGDERGTLQQWQAGEGRQRFELVRELRGHNRSITAIEFAGSDRLVTASGDNTCAQWDLATGEELLPLVLRHPKWVTSLDVSRDGRLAVTTCEDQIVRLWALDEPRVLDQMESPDVPFQSVSMAPNSEAALLASSSAAQVRLWRFSPNDPGGESAELWLDFTQPNINGAVWSAVFSPNGKKIATIGGNDARLWDLESGRQEMRFSPHGAVADATLSPDGRYVVTGSWDGSAKIWDAQTGQAVRRLDGGHTAYVNSAEFSPDGTLVLTASDDGTARLWDFETGELLDIEIRGHSSRIFQATFSPDGQHILTTSGDRTARIWNSATGRQEQVLQGHQAAVLCGRFSATGSFVITGSDDNTARIWNASSGELVRTLAGHTSGVASVAFSPDSRRVLTGSQDNTAKLWDPTPSEPKEILTLEGHRREVTSVAFSDDGRQALTGSRDGTAIVWPTVDWHQDVPIAQW